MKKQHFEDDMSTDGADEQTRQLLRIARMESDQPIERCKVLVFGTGPRAQSLFEALRPRCAATRLASSIAELQQDAKFELAIVLEPISHRVLENLMAAGGVAIDANMQRSGEWVMYDPSLNFKRIRVLSLLRQPEG